MSFDYRSATPLGQPTTYCSQYDPRLLVAIPRQDKRDELGITADSLPFVGVDVWTGYELSWLNAKGLPQVAVARFVFDAASANLVESKSFKLYLNSFNQTCFDNWEQVRATLARDLSAACGASVKVTLFHVEQAPGCVAAPAGVCLDDQEIDVDDYDLAPEHLRVGGEVVEETLYSHLLKSNCLVTGQPDWGTVVIHYRGQRIDRASLLRYIVSFRNHWAFHEQCVERIFMDIQRRCQPERLLVYARYLRRGGLDINPYRADFNAHWPLDRLLRQ